jgi:hypothetical protein
MHDPQVIDPKDLVCVAEHLEDTALNQMTHAFNLGIPSRARGFVRCTMVWITLSNDCPLTALP